MVREETAIKVVWIIIIIVFSYLIWLLFKKGGCLYEPFEDSGDVYQSIIRIYNTNLKRSPTPEELKTHFTAINVGEYDYDEIELRIINSDEYQRLIKTQTDIILPETPRIIEEKELIDRIIRIYVFVLGTECPIDMYLPLKDLYIYFEYNFYKFVALLRDSKYLAFQDNIMSDEKLSRESLIEKYLATFDDSKLNYDAAAIEEMDKTKQTGSRINDLFLPSSNSPTDDTKQSTVDTISMLSYFLENIKAEKELLKKQAEEERLNKIQDNASDVDKQQQVQTTSTTTTSAPSPSNTSNTSNTSECTSSQRIYLPDEAKIVSTEHGFRQIHKMPPVCIPVGKPNKLQDVVIYNKGLHATSIDESIDTQVGSIMPKFEYVRYIDIPVPGTLNPQ